MGSVTIFKPLFTFLLAVDKPQQQFLIAPGVAVMLVYVSLVGLVRLDRRD